MVFGRDMLLPIPVLTDLHLLRERRQTVIDDNVRRMNTKRLFRDYRIGDQVLLRTADPTKMQERAEGPYPVTQVHVNGTVTVQRAPNVFERINIRKIQPYRHPNE